MIKFDEIKLHWNYFLALEKDVETLSRYVEFCEANSETFSIELAHLLFAAASEVDVVSKAFCKIKAPTAPCNNINDYRRIILNTLPGLPAATVAVSRFGMTLTPWENWSDGHNPDWWQSYNKVKHERDQHFNQATLKNTLNAMAGLLVITFEYYHAAFAPPPGSGPWSTMEQLQPRTSLFGLQGWHYLGLGGMS